MLGVEFHHALGVIRGAIGEAVGSALGIIFCNCVTANAIGISGGSRQIVGPRYTDGAIYRVMIEARPYRATATQQGYHNGGSNHISTVLLWAFVHHYAALE